VQTVVDRKSSVLHSLHMARTQTSVDTRAVMAAVWEAVRLLAGDNGLHVDDHLTRIEVLVEAQQAIGRAIDGEILGAVDEGASNADIGDVLGVSRQAAFKTIRRISSEA
jgi:peptide subunit release factor RF-3